MEKFYSRKIKINKEQNLFRLDQALSKLSNFTRSQIKILLTNGNIKKNEKIVKEASYRVKESEEYILNLIIPQEEKFEAENIPLDIIFEDNDIIIINKHAGMVTHPSPGNNHGTLVNALLNHTNNQLSTINQKNRPGIVHRLDKETSGLIVVAKNNKSHLYLANQFKDHSISRKYKGIVWGTPQNQIIEGYIERHKINRKKMSLNNDQKGKYSNTQIKLLHTFAIASLIECTLQTGRTHQVRLHMTSINHPLVGDKIYGKNKTNQFGRNKETFNKFLILKNFPRHALHAYHLGFKHPSTNKYIEFKNDLPLDMRDLLDLIVKY
jgi:23S rRNA pseudouridine1911/1915/1917 synthase